ncbi:hypothetical protein [Thermococcus sp.]
MVILRRLQIVLLALLMVSFAGLYIVSSGSQQDSFVGVCVYSSSSFSVLSNGSADIGIPEKLELGGVYRVHGRFYRNGERMKVTVIERTSPDFPLKEIEGYYWPSRGCYLLSPERIRLGYCLNAPKGSRVLLRGIFHGSKFYPVHYTLEGFSMEFKDGLPVVVEGVVLYSGDRTVIWNGSTEIVLYLPYGVHLKPGERMRVIGIARRYSKPSVIVDSEGDVKVVGKAKVAPIQSAEIGEIGVGNCTVISKSRSGLRMDCSDKLLRGADARVGDELGVEALVRKGSLLCISCKVIRSREELPNSICGGNGVVRIHGRVEWVKVYKNGFGLANVSNGECWVLLKLRKALNVSVTPDESITAYGEFTTYRGLPALEIRSGEDVCSGKC